MTIDEAVDKLMLLKGELLFDSDDLVSLPPMAEQFALLGMSAIEQACLQLKLAKYHQMQGR